MSLQAATSEGAQCKLDHDPPYRLDLGGGRDPEPGHVNVDLRDVPETDLVADATDVPLPDDSVERIHCNSLVPHVDDLNALMEECSRLLQPGGELIIKATHAHSTGIVQDPDHNHWSWTSRTPEWFGNGSEFAYYSDVDLILVDVDVVGWLRPYRRWLRPPSWLFGQVVETIPNDLADELMKLPLAGGRVIARFRASNPSQDSITTPHTS